MGKQGFLKQFFSLKVPGSKPFKLIIRLFYVLFFLLFLEIVLPPCPQPKGNARVTATKVQVEIFMQGLGQFKLDTGRYPTTQEGLQALITNPGIDNWEGPYLRKNKVPTDGWKKPFNYQSPGANGEYDLYSYGADEAAGGEGYNADINSWE